MVIYSKERGSHQIIMQIVECNDTSERVVATRWGAVGGGWQQYCRNVGLIFRVHTRTPNVSNMIVKKWNGMNPHGVWVLVTDLIIPAAS